MPRKPKSVPETAPAPSAVCSLADVEQVKSDSRRAAIATAKRIAGGGSVARGDLEAALAVLNGTFDSEVQAEKDRIAAAEKLPAMRQQRADLFSQFERVAAENAKWLEARDRLRDEQAEAEKQQLITYSQRNTLSNRVNALDDQIAAVERAAEVRC